MSSSNCNHLKEVTHVSTWTFEEVVCSVKLGWCAILTQSQKVIKRLFCHKSSDMHVKVVKYLTHNQNVSQDSSLGENSGKFRHSGLCTYKLLFSCTMGYSWSLFDVHSCNTGGIFRSNNYRSPTARLPSQQHVLLMSHGISNKDVSLETGQLHPI